MLIFRQIRRNQTKCPEEVILRVWNARGKQNLRSKQKRNRLDTDYDPQYNENYDCMFGEEIKGKYRCM